LVRWPWRWLTGRVELFLGWHDWGRAEGELRRAVPAETAEAVATAVGFARAWHGDQRRPTGTPYLEHLLEALEVLVRGAGILDRDVLCAAVLHDVVEDTLCRLEEITETFGPEVAELVGWVTIPEVQPGQIKAEVKEAYLRRLRDAPERARLVKLADRVSNVQTLRNLAPAKQRSYYAQTVTYIVPLAELDPWFARWYAAWQQDFADLG
jgi:(p)ppGpp synthase/HD superfamily hydrolase